MLFWTKDECVQWCNSRIPAFQPYSLSSLAQSDLKMFTFQIPQLSGRLAALSLNFHRLMGFIGGSLIWVTGYGVFPSSENFNLFYGYRKSLGEDRSLHEIPGHFVLEHEREEFASLIQLLLIPPWDVWIIDNEVKTICRLDHDEHCIIWVPPDRETGDIVGRLTEFGLQITSR